MLEPTSGNTGISLAMICRVRGYRMRAVMPESATPERADSLRMYGAEIVWSPGELGSNGAVALARELAAADPDVYMPFQYANPANPDAHYRTTGPEIIEALGGRVDAFVAGLGTGGTLMGTGQALREANPAVKIIAAEPLQGDAVMGLRSLEDGYTPEILDVSKLDRRAARLERRRARRPARAARPTRASGRASPPVPWSRSRRRVAASMEPDQNVVCLLADGGWKYASAGLWSRDADELEERHGGPALVVADAPLQLPRAIADEIAEHARAGLPTRRAGSSPASTPRRRGSTRRSTATRARSATRSTPQDLLRIVTDIDDAEEDLLAIYHSHTRSPAFPSRTDVELAFWPDAAYLIVSLASDPPDLKAFTIRDGRIAKRELVLT